VGKGPIAAGIAVVTGLAGGVALFPSVMAMVASTVAAADHQPVSRTQVVVDDVVDGDTLRVRTPGGRDLGRVRLLGIIH
jgi:endonuclease YncB( thermonuclease family)